MEMISFENSQVLKFIPQNKLNTLKLDSVPPK